MERLFIYIFVGWGVGMVGFVVLNKANKYNNRIYYDVSKEIIKYKKIKDKTNINKK